MSLSCVQRLLRFWPLRTFWSRPYCGVASILCSSKLDLAYVKHFPRSSLYSQSSTSQACAVGVTVAWVISAFSVPWRQQACILFKNLQLLQAWQGWFISSPQDVTWSDLTGVSGKLGLLSDVNSAGLLPRGPQFLCKWPFQGLLGLPYNMAAEYREQESPRERNWVTNC